MAKDKALRSLAAVEKEFRKIGMAITADTVKDVINDLANEDRAAARSFEWLSDQAMAIERLAHKELKGKMFLYVPAERASSGLP